MIFEIYSFKSLPLCNRPPLRIFIGDGPTLIDRFSKPIGNEFAIVEKGVSCEGGAPIYSYTKTSPIGARILSNITAVRDNPSLDIQFSNGIEVYMGGYKLYSSWRSIDNGRCNVTLPLKTGQVSQLEIFWYNNCKDGKLIVKNRGIRDSIPLDHAMQSLSKVIFGSRG